MTTIAYFSKLSLIFDFFYSGNLWLWIVFTIFYPLFVYFSLWLFHRGYKAYKLMKNSTKWSATTGELLDTKILYNNFASSGSYNFDFIVVKKYRYTIDGIVYTSNTDLPSDHLFIGEYNSMAHFSGHYGDYKQELGYHTAKKQENHLKKSPLMVYFDPENPQRSCLRTGVKGSVYVTMGMGLFLFLLLILLGLEIVF